MNSTQASGEIEIGVVINRIIETYKATANVLLPGAVIVFLPVALLTAALSGGAGALLALIVAVVASLWYTGMVTRTVQDVQDGRVDASLEELFKSVTPVLGQLFLLGILAGVGVLIGFILLVIPGLILLTIWAVAAPVVVIESKGATEALGRSRELVRGNGWTVFGVLVVIFAGEIVLSLIVGSIGAVSDSFVLRFLVQLLLNVAVAPLAALAAAVLYFALTGARGEATVPVAPAAPFSPPPAAPAIIPDVGSASTDAFGNPAGAAPPQMFAPPVAPSPAPDPPAQAAEPAAYVPGAPGGAADPQPVVPAPPAPEPEPAFDPPPAPEPAPDPEPAFDPPPAPEPAPDPEPAFDPPPAPIDGPPDDEPPPRTESIGPPR